MKVALWIMNRFAVNPSLVGDLTEEWSSGQSWLWLLRQTLVAVASAIWSGLWHHKIRTVAAVTIGWIGWVLLGTLFPYGIYALGYPDFPVGMLLFIVRPVLLGWILGRLQPTQPMGTALLYIATFIILSLSQSSLHSQDYGAVLAIGSWLILTTAVGGLLAARKQKVFQS